MNPVPLAKLLLTLLIYFKFVSCREIGGEITQDGDFFLFESNRYRNGFLYKNIAMSGVVSTDSLLLIWIFFVFNLF